MITPLEIENKKFSKKALNGYSPEEVDDFLDELVKDYEELYKNSTESTRIIEDLETKLEHYKEIESAMQGTLLMAQSAAEESKKTAQKEAEQIIKEAEVRAKEATSEIDRNIVAKTKDLENVKKQFDVYKAKMESLLISQLELLKEVNKSDE